MLLLEPILQVTAALVGAGMYETNEVAFSRLMYVLSVSRCDLQFVVIVAVSSKYTAAVLSGLLLGPLCQCCCIGTFLRAWCMCGGPWRRG